MNDDILAYQGRPGAFSELAARQFVGETALLLPCRRFVDVVTAVAQGAAEFGTLPIRNSLAGTIADTCTLIAHRRVTVLAEVTLNISHALLAVPGTDFARVRRVLSHPVALRQCSGFFRRHPQLKMVDCEDTAGSIELLINKSLHDAAAIAGAHAAAYYGAQVLAENLEDSPANQTLFVLIGA